MANVRKSTSFDGIVGFNIGKNKDTPNENAVDDYLTALRAAWPVADYVAVNLSSPNTPGLRDLQAADSTAALLARLRKEQAALSSESGRHVPIAFKVAPDLEDAHIQALARVFLDGDWKPSSPPTPPSPARPSPDTRWPMKPAASRVARSPAAPPRSSRPSTPNSDPGSRSSASEAS